MPVTRRRIVQSALAAAALAAPAFAAVPKAKKPMKLLILGGTGFIGPHQVRYALARGHQVTIFNRGRQKEAWPGPVEELLGDRAGDLKALEGRSWDACIDNPTTVPAWVRDAARVLKGHIGHYSFISTISVYASNDKPADETAPVAQYKGADPFAETAADVSKDLRLYGPLKAISEQEAIGRYGADKVAVIRPGLICGPGDQTDRFTYWPVRLAKKDLLGGEVLAPGDGHDPTQMIDARDLAEWTIRVAEQRTAGTFNATGPNAPVPMRRFLEGVAAGVGARPTYAWAPEAFLEANHVSAWTDMPVWVPESGETAGFHHRANARAIHAGLTFRPLGVTAADTLAWFRTLPAERQAKMRAGLTPEREAELLAKLKAA
jgi:2'-hydroxyisoflavone reductase